MKNKALAEPATRKRKLIPLDCSLVLVLAMTIYAVYLVLFIMGIFYSADMARIFQKYEPDVVSGRELYLFLSGGVFLYGLAVAGLMLMIFKVRGGFYVFSAAIIVTLVIDLVFFEFDWIRYLVNTGLVFILGIQHFSGRCYRKKKPREAQPGNQ